MMIFGELFIYYYFKQIIYKENHDDHIIQDFNNNLIEEVYFIVFLIEIKFIN